MNLKIHFSFILSLLISKAKAKFKGLRYQTDGLQHENNLDRQEVRFLQVVPDPSEALTSLGPAEAPTADSLVLLFRHFVLVRIFSVTPFAIRDLSRTIERSD